MHLKMSSAKGRLFSLGLYKLNYNGCTIEIWKWKTIFIPQFVMGVITNPFCEFIQAMLEKRFL